MQQALNNFNAGKYKQAFSQLSSTTSNAQSHQPNLAILEYLLSRTLNSSQVCLRKLSALMVKKSKKENDHYERITDQVIKYNIAILMMLTGRKENAYSIISDIYSRQKCFIDFMKYRMLLLLMELSLSMKNNLEALRLSCTYISSPYEQKAPSNQWISLIFHEHSKSSSILKEELDFMMCIFMSQAIMQLKVSELELPPDDTRTQARDILLQKAKKRKNNTNKYYQLNLLMIDRFHQAQREFHAAQKKHDQAGMGKAMSLLHFSNIQNQYEQMPQTKIITNIYSALSANNIAVINFTLGRAYTALHLLNKAQTLLAKGCTGVEDKDLQLFSANYANHSYKITYNLALVSLSREQTQAYQLFEYIKKMNLQGQDFKCWYRTGQAELQYFFDNYSKFTEQARKMILKSSLKSFNQALFCLSKREIPTLEISKAISILREEQLEAIILKMKGEVQTFKQNILLILCYVNLLLHQFNKAIFYAKQLLNSDKTRDDARLLALQYLIQAYGKSNRYKDANKTINEAEKLMKDNKKMIINSHYYKENEIIMEQMDITNVMVHQSTVIKIRQKNIKEAMNLLEKEKDKVKNKSRTFKTRNILKKYLQDRSVQQR